MIREIGVKNRKQPFLSLILVLRVLNDYDQALSHQVFKLHELGLLAKFKRMAAELINYKQKLKIHEAEMAQLKNKSIDVDLRGGKFLFYGYECSNKIKFGFSFRNKKVKDPNLTKHLFQILVQVPLSIDRKIIYKNLTKQ